MNRYKRLLAGSLLLGATLVFALAHRPHEVRPTAALGPAEVPAETPAREESGAAVAEPAPAPAAVPAPVAKDDATSAREQKQVLAHDAEAARIAAREQKLAKLDWDAPRPGAPPADRRVPVSKKEAELTVEEKLEKTERITSQLQDRIRRTRAEVESAAKNGEDDGTEAMLLARLQARVSELEERAQVLRGERTEGEPAGGQAPAVSPEVTQ